MQGCGAFGSAHAQAQAAVEGKGALWQLRDHMRCADAAIGVEACDVVQSGEAVAPAQPMRGKVENLRTIQQDADAGRGNVECELRMACGQIHRTGDLGFP